ncbi:tubulin polyglutamylase TTLL5-like [Clytia hemisphaerica]|uniref:Tubulin--tyrosine ligase-like protein 5 n=1 Tax=Clytia hemisphaerica TaxID=252671 RepID=A0A7M5VEK0_9CNID
MSKKTTIDSIPQSPPCSIDNGEEDGEGCNDEIHSKTSSEINGPRGDFFGLRSTTSTGKKRLYVDFNSSCVVLGWKRENKKYDLGYKFISTECKLVRTLLHSHGFKETAQNSTNFNLMWSGSHVKPYSLRGLKVYQKFNHFPRSYELTRKDRLYKNVQKMQHSKGLRHFDFIPQSFVLPTELNDFYAAFLKDRGPWIVKPCALSRGRGIFLVNNINKIPLDENVLVCRYINNPLLVNGYKFDCRIYVAVMSYDPLRIYIYEEGLARFSTVKYEAGSSSNLQNQCMHLTNYSLNKFSDGYVRCEDPEVDNYGSKWSFSAMLRHLKEEEGIDTKLLMARIEDVIIKTILAGELTIAIACKMFVPFPENCFELYGFDILVDSNLKPWLLEVNLSPSLACDAPMDLKIKANLITDLFNMTGFLVEEPVTKTRKNSKNINFKNRENLLSATRRPSTHNNRHSNNTKQSNNKTTNLLHKPKDGLSKEERKMVWIAKEEYKNRGGFIRVYPSPESWELYSSLQDHQTTNNRMLHSQLFPQLWNSGTTTQTTTYIARARNFSSISKPIFDSVTDSTVGNFYKRFLQYERKLGGWNTPQDSPQKQIHDLKASTRPPHRQRERIKQGELQSDDNNLYENKLLDGCHDYKANVQPEDVLKKAQHLNKYQAREAFSVYLQRVQHRLLQEIGQSQDNYAYQKIDFEDLEKQEHQINLIHRFLMKAAVNLSNPINVIIPHQNLPIFERKRILARQLNDFIKVYRKESKILFEREEEEIACSIDQQAFNTFIAISSEQQLEDLLTVYTKHNKSASIFLGAKSSSIKKSSTATADVARDDLSKSNPSTSQFQTTNTNMNRLKSGTSVLSNHRPLSFKPPSTAKPPQSSGHTRYNKTSRQSSRSSSANRHSRSLSEPDTNLAVDPHNRPFSTTSIERRLINQSTQRQRGLSANSSRGSLRRATSQEKIRSSNKDSIGGLRRVDSRERMRETVCVYTGSNELLNQYQKQQREQPKIKEALRKLSNRQSQRTYSARSTNSIKQLNDRDQAIRDYRDFLRRNEQFFRDNKNEDLLDENTDWDFSHQILAGKEDVIVYAPKPPKEKKPSVMSSKSRFTRKISK